MPDTYWPGRREFGGCMIKIQDDFEHLVGDVMLASWRWLSTDILELCASVSEQDKHGYCFAECH